MAPNDKPCCLGTVKEGELKGKNVTLGPLTTYVTGNTEPGASVVLAVPDIYGFGIPNTRYLVKLRFIVCRPGLPFVGV